MSVDTLATMSDELAMDPTKALADLAEEANEHHRACEESYRTALEHAWHAGMALRSAQSLMEYGDWLPWLEQNFAASQRTAYRYIEVAPSLPRVTSCQKGRSGQRWRRAAPRNATAAGSS
jgi:hypothetical protein